jgi:hypothetical protein
LAKIATIFQLSFDNSVIHDVQKELKLFSMGASTKSNVVRGIINGHNIEFFDEYGLSYSPLLAPNTMKNWSSRAPYSKARSILKIDNQTRFLRGIFFSLVSAKRLNQELSKI